ncbi:MAG: polyprenyl synthetase family protein [Nitrosopumilales archaeon]|nr:polyprenyl synthetase family protein [Nitrosopumilales archaeon]
MKAIDIKDELESNASSVNQYILSLLEGDPIELYRASSHYIKSGGKRLRPFLLIKSSEMFGGNLRRALPAAAAVELVHNFSLVHDDIMDNDDMRHSVQTVHKHYGMPLAILAGDILFSKAFELLAVHGRAKGISEKAICEMVAKLSSACIQVCEGQATDVHMASMNDELSIDSPQYINMISKKTAALFELSCALGVLSAPNSSAIDVERLSWFGRNIGIAFQLVDDLIGITGDPKLTGKAVGNDLREGKKTYPILLALRNAKGENRSKILKIFGRKNASASDLKEAVGTISTIGIDQEIRLAARTHIEKAVQSLADYVDSEAKRALESSASFIVERSL